ncbi:glycoside hydrolase family 92 protein [Athelia psychrophila]|uniref:Glycoside hydrolase family 92 protein n=1 Tax=Athelia psychrophila TaxID=1759441 RepID=A0A166KL88_9AGAM|nr:glycoside hydrolase family 92 protein [Fibularhizoctonia sp. CBS 109695]
MIDGQWGSSFGPSEYHYQAFACYDLLNGGNQNLAEYGMWTTDTSMQKPRVSPRSTVSVSFVSSEQACTNAESEVSGTSFEQAIAAGSALWQEKLRKIEIDVANTPANVTGIFYSSLYRSLLTPNNTTDETQGVFADRTSFYFHSLYCSWDTFQTFYPLLSLTSLVEFAQIVENYVDG